MPGPVPDIHDFLFHTNVEGRGKPGQTNNRNVLPKKPCGAVLLGAAHVSDLVGIDYHALAHPDEGGH